MNKNGKTFSASSPSLNSPLSLRYPGVAHAFIILDLIWSVSTHSFTHTYTRRRSQLSRPSRSLCVTHTQAAPLSSHTLSY